MSDAWHGVEYAFTKAASVVTFGLVHDPDDPEVNMGDPGTITAGIRAQGLTYDEALLKQPNVNPDDSTLLLAQNYQQEDDYLRRSNPVVKPAAPKDEISPETLMIAGGLLAAAVLLSE